MSAMPAVATVRQLTPEWLDARLDAITASDLPVITGNSPYRSSQVDLWAAKTRLLEPETPDPETQELWDLGHALEPVIADRYTVITGRRVRRANLMVRSKTLPWAAASLDRVSARKGERRIIELKWAPHRRWIDGPEPVPADVQDQVQWQLMVSRYDVAEVAVLNGSHVEVHEVGPDDGYQANLVYLARHFRGFIERRELPPIDSSDATRKALVRMHPRETLGLMEPSELTFAMAVQLREAKAAVKAAEEVEGRLSNELRAFLGEHAGVDGEDYRIQYTKNADGASINWQAAYTDLRFLIDLARAARAAVLWEALPDPDEIVTHHTALKQGARPLRLRMKNEETGRWS